MGILLIISQPITTSSLSYNIIIITWILDTGYNNSSEERG
jgi:hypothetical protein